MGPKSFKIKEENITMLMSYKMIDNNNLKFNKIKDIWINLVPTNPDYF